MTAPASSANSKTSSLQSNSTASPVGRPGKEVEMASISAENAIREVSTEIEIPEEVERVGVKLSGKIELPPDLKKLGVSVSPPQAPVISASSIVLPINDDQIIQGTKSPVTSALRWLALWSIRQLLKAHIALKKIHGSVIRVKVK